MKTAQTIPSALFLFLTVLCQPMQAQPWSPLTLHEKYDFRSDGYNFITNTIWTDSAKVEGGDSVYYLNRIVTGCDTCWGGIKLSGQPGFLKSRMVMKPDGICNFRDPGSVVIKTHALTGDSWLFDTVNNIQAQVTTGQVGQVFGTSDSIKEILLSNGLLIRLSKNFGLLKFPYYGDGSYYYTLEGIEGRNVGKLVPKFAEIYDFNPGDVFQYEGKSMSYSVPNGGGSGYLEKIRILEKDSIAGHYTYNIQRISCSWSLSVQGIPWDTVHSYSYDTLDFQDSLTHLANYYPGQIVENPISTSLCGPNTCYFRSLDDANQVFLKCIGAFNLCDDPATFIHGTAATPPLPWFVLLPGTIDVYLNVFKPGLGNTYYHLMFFEKEELRELVGYIKNGDTTGYIYPDDLILQGIKNDNANREWMIRPNPAVNFLHVSRPASFVDAEAVIRNMAGVLVRKMPFKTGIDISDLAPGNYFITIKETGHGKTWTGRFVKQ